MGQTNYAASKAGVIGLTQSAARELGRLVRQLGACEKSGGRGQCSVLSGVSRHSPFHRHRIRCNSVLPGFIRTPMTQKVPQKVLDKVGDCGWRAESFRDQPLWASERMLGPLQGKQQIFNNCTRNEDPKNKSQSFSYKKPTKETFTLM